jgi:uncharacterized protein (TIGR03663 family)
VSEIAQPLPGRPAIEGRDALKALSAQIALSWEAAAWAALVVLGFGFRFWDLGARAMHHDESLHAYYSYQLLQGNGYEHSPLLHGPFQFFGTALTFFVTGGASDYTARVLPALFGAVLVVLPLALRNRLGRSGALVTAALIAFSPTVLYYSRFAREDIYFALFTLGIVVCLWRYIDEKRPQYLYGLAALLALSFATKETAFILAAVMLLFLNLWAAAEMASQAGTARRRTGVSFILYAPFAWAIVAFEPFMGSLRRRFGLDERHPAMDTLRMLGTLAGPQFAATVELPFEAAGVDITSVSAERALAIPTVLGLIAASTVIGVAWNRRVWLTASVCFYLPYTLLFTAFLTDIDGFGSGIWESLDHWLAQHEAQRANQPEFYYLMFWPTYDYLALAFAGPALLFFALRGGPRSWLLTAITVVALLFFFGADSFARSRAIEISQIALLPVAALALFLAVRGTMFERFLVFWTAASLVAYSTVGEKMPWLSVHTALPMILLAGYAASRLLSSARGGSPEVARHRTAFARTFAIGGGLAALVLAAFSIRTAVMASYDHGDVPREFLFYTQTSPDVPDIVERIDHLAASSGRGHSLRIQVDAEQTWPWAWHLREYDVSFQSMGKGFAPEAGAVLLLSAPNEIYTASYSDSYQSAQRFTLLWWFPEEYRGIGNKNNLGDAVVDFAADLVERKTWERWWGFWFHRDILPRGGIEGRLLVPLEYEAFDLVQVIDGPAASEADGGPQADVEGRSIIGRLGTGPAEMQKPAGVVLDAQGNIYVVDTDLERVQKFDARGSLIAAQGGPGSEPGQFNQPSDIAVDPAGNVYVADTWNHRIQKFGPDLAPAGSWGQATRDLTNPGPSDFWGPRGIAIDRDGNVLVADTGTNRIRRYAPDGTHLGDLGRRGKQIGEFEEPTGVAVGADGSVYVADAGNARIQRFDTQFKFLAAWPLEDWADRAPRNKPQLEALPNGRLIATDPAHSQLLLISALGQVAARLDTAVDVPLFSPNGIAYDSEREFVYVTDGLAGHIRRFPYTDFALSSR